MELKERLASESTEQLSNAAGTRSCPVGCSSRLGSLSGIPNPDGCAGALTAFVDRLSASTTRKFLTPLTAHEVDDRLDIRRRWMLQAGKHLLPPQAAIPDAPFAGGLDGGSERNEEGAR